MSKRIFLLRHATSPAGMVRDIQRQLSLTGHNEAKTIGAAMQENGFLPDYVLCSEAVRTRETLNAILEATNIQCPIDFQENLYHGQKGEYFRALQSVDNKYKSVLLIGHNPIIPAFAGFLADTESSNKEALNKLMRPYVPATLSAFECPILAWEDLLPHHNILTDVIAPTPAA